LGHGVVTMAVSLAVCEIYSVKEWRDFENWVRGCSRSLKMAPFDRSCTTFYLSAIVTTLCSEKNTPFSVEMASQTILVFTYQAGWRYSNGDPLMGRNPTTSCDYWRRPSQVCWRPSPVLDCTEPATVVAARRRFNAQREILNLKLNWTERSSSVQLSSV